MGASAGPGGTSAPKITIDVEEWAAKPPEKILEAVRNRTEWIAEHRAALGPTNPHNISYALLIQRFQEERRVLQALIRPKEVSPSPEDT